MPATHTYPAEIERDEDGRYVVTFPDFGWGATDGATRDEALAEGQGPAAGTDCHYVPRRRSSACPVLPREWSSLGRASEIALTAELDRSPQQGRICRRPPNPLAVHHYGESRNEQSIYVDYFVEISQTSPPYAA